ncbi:hypothetical protein [Paenibacillus sp. DMB5]|uniref:hypothetical protein n=1 Tax=Paenibacillus sp. DMB5 TaxID=1780103 RepID=UPI00076C0FC8|nr:hypothetical protein [Paenibacillus sp. DMB5]KUP21985.1 hypothetical protein AWJ19_06110 [Paenibacillus sp. DMB5]
MEPRGLPALPVYLLEQNARFREQAPQHRYTGVSGADHTFDTADPYKGPTRDLNEALALTLEFLHEKLVRRRAGVNLVGFSPLISLNSRKY